MPENLSSPRWVRLLPPILRNHLHGRTNLVAIIENSGWLIFDKLARMLMGLAVSVWVARYLGPAQYGELAYALAFVALFQAVATFGLDGIVVRDIARDKTLAGEILGSAFFLRLTIGVLCWTGAIAAMVVIDGLGNQSVLLLALAGGTLVFQAADTVDLWFQSQSQSRRTVFPKLFAYVISNGVKVALILAEAPLWSFAAVISLEAIFAAFGMFISYKIFPSPGTWSRSSQMIRQLLKEGWPFMLSGISIMVYMRIDQIMIKEMLGERELGIYSAIQPLATIWQFIPMVLMSSLAPFVAKKKMEGEVVYWDALQQIFRGFSLLGWGVCIPISLLSDHIVFFLYGPQYEMGGTVLVVYIFSNIFINLGVAQSLWVLNESKPYIWFMKVVLGAVFSVASNYLLIPNFGIVGAAWSAVLSQAVSVVLSNIYFANKIFKLQVLSICFPIPRLR